MSQSKDDAKKIVQNKLPVPRDSERNCLSRGMKS
jgi:hypothetical protein